MSLLQSCSFGASVFRRAVLPATAATDDARFLTDYSDSGAGG